jgi:hypothetical protein
MTIFTILSFQSFGQFIKGDKVLGGTFSFSGQRAPESPNGGPINKATSLSITPNFGILLNENLEIGLQVGYSSTEYERNTTTPTISNWGSRGMTVGLYTQRYFVITDKFLFSVTGNIRYDFGKTFDKTTNTITNEVTESEDKDSSIGVTLRPSFIFFPSNNWAFQTSIGNISYSYSNNDDQPVNLFNVNYGTINLGLSYYFRQKTKE